jgi:hypothetical protein
MKSIRLKGQELADCMANDGYPTDALMELLDQVITGMQEAARTKKFPSLSSMISSRKKNPTTMNPKARSNSR